MIFDHVWESGSGIIKRLFLFFFIFFLLGQETGISTHSQHQELGIFCLPYLFITPLSPAGINTAFFFFLFFFSAFILSYLYCTIYSVVQQSDNVVVFHLYMQLLFVFLLLTWQIDDIVSLPEQSFSRQQTAYIQFCENNCSVQKSLKK